jgi:hypothetical protein
MNKSKIENLFNLTNYKDHPEDENHVVFFFYNLEQAAYFENLLKKETIEFESFLDEDAKRSVMLYAIHRKYFRRALIQNDLSYAGFKRKFIPQIWLRYAVLLFTLGLTLFALIGYLKSH